MPCGRFTADDWASLRARERGVAQRAAEKGRAAVYDYQVGNVM